MDKTTTSLLPWCSANNSEYLTQLKIYLLSSYISLAETFGCLVYAPDVGRTAEELFSVQLDFHLGCYRKETRTDTHLLHTILPYPSTCSLHEIPCTSSVPNSCSVRKENRTCWERI